MYLVDLRWIVLTICVLGAGIGVAIAPALISPILVSVAVATILYVILRLGQPPNSGGP